MTKKTRVHVHRRHTMRIKKSEKERRRMFGIAYTPGLKIHNVRSAYIIFRDMRSVFGSGRANPAGVILRNPFPASPPDGVPWPAWVLRSLKLITMRKRAHQSHAPAPRASRNSLLLLCELMRCPLIFLCSALRAHRALCIISLMSSANNVL